MTYPVDDAGNPRVDFVWGPFPLQPNDQREGRDINGAYTTDGIWTNKAAVGSDNLDSGWTTLTFGTGDGDGVREQTFTWDNHEIAASNYEGYPSFIQGAPYDDTILNSVVPNVVGLTIVQAQSALENVFLTTDEATTTVGATSENNGKVKTQSPAAGTTVNQGTLVTLTKYNYVAVTTGPISSIISTDGALGADEVWMYLLGRTVKPTVGDYVTVAGSASSQFNSNNYEVLSVADDDAFNTGGTKVKLHCVTGTITPAVQSVGGTWTKVG